MIRRGRGARSAAARAYAEAPRPSRQTPWREARFAVLDLETTGLDPRRDELIQFGVVPIDGGRIAAGAAVEGLVRPSRMPARGNVEVHGIRPLDLAEAPLPPGAIEPLLAALAGRVLVAHVAGIERAFLGPALAAAGVRRRGDVVDTAELGRVLPLLRGGRDPGRLPLPRLAAALGLPSDRAHHALGDALTTAQCFLALATHLEGMQGRLTVGDLATAGRTLRTLRATRG